MPRVWLFLKVDTTLVVASIVLRAGNYSTYSNGTDKCAECLLVKTGFWVADDGCSPAARIKIIVNSIATTPEREPEGSDDH
jgi:hypothetical protein